MKFTIITVGKIKEQYLRDAITAYAKEIRKNHLLELIEVDDEKAPENLSEALMEKIKEVEGNKILNKITDQMYVVTLEILGKELSTDKFRKMINQAKQMNKEEVAFIIGGSLGLDKKVSSRANYKLSFSKLTFPHQLMKVILLEQLGTYEG